MFNNGLPHKASFWTNIRAASTKLSRAGTLVEAVVVISTIRLGLARLRYPTLVQFLSASARLLRTSNKSTNAQRRVISAIRRAQRWGAGELSCLEEALSIQWMLQRRNIDAQLQIGVAKTQDNCLIAHAWVEYAGHVVSIDPQSPNSYVLLIPSTNGLPNESHRGHLPL